LIFTGILLCHQHRQAIVEIQVGAREARVVGVCVAHEREAEAFQHREVALGVADRRHRVHTLTAERGQGARLAGTGQRERALARHVHRHAGRGTVGCPVGFATRLVDHDEIDACQALGRLAQRSGRNHPPVAEAARTIHHRDLEVARQGPVLQPVVRDQHVASVCVGEQSARLDAPRCDCDRQRRRAGDQHGLVAGPGRRRVGSHQERTALAPAVPAQDHARGASRAPRARAPARSSAASCRCRRPVMLPITTTGTESRVLRKIPSR
jgi:hypothetical protein